MDNCIFCKIAKKEIPSHMIWEDESHMAFLSIFPNTPGFTVVIVKEHYGGHAFHQNAETLLQLVAKAQKVAGILENAFEDVGRIAMVIEGVGVDHLHVKLIPLHGTEKDGSWKGKTKSPKTFFDKYQGYIASYDCEQADAEELALLAKKIRENTK